MHKKSGGRIFTKNIRLSDLKINNICCPAVCTKSWLNMTSSKKVISKVYVFLNDPRIIINATLFTTPLSNDISDNMRSRLILTLTKQLFDNQFTHFMIKTRKVLCTMHVYEGTIFCCVRSSRRKFSNIGYFSLQM